MKEKNIQQMKGGSKAKRGKGRDLTEEFNSRVIKPRNKNKGGREQ